MSTEPTYDEMELSAVGEIANIGSGGAATALGQLLGRVVDLDPPKIEFVEIYEAAERIGPVETPVMAVLTPLVGVPSSLLLAFPYESAQLLCSLLGTDAETELGESCLLEIGNILTASFATAISTMTGLALEPEPPLLACDMLGSVVDAVLAQSAETADKVLFLQTRLHVDGVRCDFGFLFIPQRDAIAAMLAALGL